MRWVLLPLLLALAGCASPPPPAATKAEPDHPSQWNANYYALLIGNYAYAHWRPLPGVLTDIYALREALEANQVTTLLYTNLTLAQARRIIPEFLFTYGKNPENRLLLYYAGHGTTETGRDGAPWGGLVMTDAPPPQSSQARFGAFSMSDLEMQTLMVPARQMLVLLDACFSGAVFRDAPDPQPPTSDEERKRGERAPTRQFVTSGDAQDKVPDFSQFNAALVNLLTGKVREPRWDGYLTGSELGAYLQRALPTLTGQTPQYGTIRDAKFNGGDFVLRLNPTFSPAPIDRPAPVKFVTNLDRISIYLNGQSVGTASRKQPLLTQVLPGDYMLKAVKPFSTTEPIERIQVISNVWATQEIALRFQLPLPPPP